MCEGSGKGGLGEKRVSKRERYGYGLDRHRYEESGLLFDESVCQE